jgi:hypothetical protein
MNFTTLPETLEPFNLPKNYISCNVLYFDLKHGPDFSGAIGLWLILELKDILQSPDFSKPITLRNRE